MDRPPAADEPAPDRPGPAAPPPAPAASPVVAPPASAGAPLQGRRSRPGRLVLVRHGRTEWARTGQHTGRTDVPLDDVGRAQARALPAVLDDLLEGRAPGLVLSSPLSRALDTARLAGLGDAAEIEVDPDLAEWDYGAYEGLTSAQVRALRGQEDWTAFADGMAPGGPGRFPGESLQDVAARTARVLARAREHWATSPGTDVVAVAHGHSLRVLATVWLRLAPGAGAALLLDPASVAVLDHEHGVPGVRHWNLTPHLVGHDPA